MLIIQTVRALGHPSGNTSMFTLIELPASTEQGGATYCTLATEGDLSFRKQKIKQFKLYYSDFNLLTSSFNRAFSIRRFCSLKCMSLPSGGSPQDGQITFFSVSLMAMFSHRNLSFSARSMELSARSCWA